MIIRTHIGQSQIGPAVQIEGVMNAWSLTLYGALPKPWTGYNAKGKCYYRFQWLGMSIILTVDGEETTIRGAIGEMAYE